VKRRVIMIILILLTFVLQTTLMQTFAIASVSPNLPIILTVSFALMRGKREGMFVGAFFGILMDIFYGPVLGFHMLLFTYVGYFNGFCYRIFYDDDIKMPVLLIAFSDLVYDLVVFLSRKDQPVLLSEKDHYTGSDLYCTDHAGCIPPASGIEP